MSNRVDQLNVILNTYFTTRDCIRVTTRAHKQQDLRLLSDTGFTALEVPAAEELTEKCRKEVEDYAIVALWAVFERFLIEYLQTKGLPLRDVPPTAFSEPFFEKFEIEVERWRIVEILDLFKPIIDPDLLGKAKQIKKYRDWLAHKNDRKGHDGKTDPKAAYQILSKIIQSIEGAQ
ncbi:hypothetical protein [Desulfomonile tiedjei]|uniref:RiboL-PSP-HEPN domain-containing protein n=1 Tax=Desulfomonile tiedjei (strain ATCC 49306 / DSM 6799 / DCB-1) TaxID=706587 RepID=I4CBG2_DESTA|nr:hypothetical protein [Desulfomonile tiedjei]AFM26903.1 hypothetical protein Desti_4269 [Desulfomonile tiedjei DSM 6799]